MVLAYIDLAIVFHCLVFAVIFLLRKGGVGRSNFFLSVLLFTVSLLSLPYALKPTGWIFYLPYFVDVEWAAGFLFVPIYFWFVKEMMGEKVAFKFKDVILLVPAIVAFFYFSSFYFKSAEEQLAYLKLVQFTYTEEYQIGDMLFFPFMTGFLIYIIVYLRRKKSSLSGVLLSNCTWLIKYTTLLVSYSLLAALVYAMGLPAIYINAIPLLSAAMYIALIFRFLQQSGLQFEDVKNEYQKSMQKKPKYVGSNLNQNQASKLNDELEKIMEDKKLYLDQQLSLQVLANELQTTPHHLSRVINEFHCKNFSDFVNDYRVREAMGMIMRNELTKLEAIAYDCGFNTKTTFNAAFKKITGLTPSGYRKINNSKRGTDL